MSTPYYVDRRIDVIGFTFNSTYVKNLTSLVTDIKYVRASNTLSFNISFSANISFGAKRYYIGKLNPNLYSPNTDTERIQLSIDSPGGHAYINDVGKVYASFGETVSAGKTVYISGYYYVGY